MDHQGSRITEVNSNANIQNEVNNHLSIGTSQRLHPSSRYHIAGSEQRFSDRLFRPNINLTAESANINILPNNGRSVGVSLHESTGGLGLSISSPSSLTTSLERFPDGLSIPNVLHYQGTALTIPQSNVDSNARHVWNNPSGNPGVHGGISTSMMRSSFKRRSTDDASGEFLVGESSSMGAEAGIAKRRVASSDVNANNNVNISSLYSVPANSDLRNFEAEIVHNALTSVSEMQHLRESPQTESFQSNINVQITTATTPQAFMHTNRFSNGYTSGEQVPLPGHATLFFQIDRPPSVSSSETVFGATDDASGNAPLQIHPFYFGTGSEAMGPSHNDINIQGNILLGPQPQIESGTDSFVGNFPNPCEQYGSFSGSVNVSNAPDQLIPQFDRYILPIEMMSPELPSVDPSEILQQMELSFGVGNYGAENEHTSLAISDIQADANSESLAASASLDRAEMRRRLAAQVQGQGVAEDQNEEANTRLTEEQIMTYIRHENFESVGEETLENKEECCICLEDFVNGKEVGKLDCMHRFHVNCIKQWLVQHNVCPICNRMVLAIDQIVHH